MDLKTFSDGLVQRNLYVVLLLLFAGLGLSTVASASHGDHPHPQDRDFVSVTGQGKVEVVPDEVRFVVGVDAKRPTARQAYQAVEDRMADALKVLQKLGIPERDIQAMHIQLNPIIDYKQRDRIIAHDARRDINVKVSDMETYARAIEQLAELEITRFQQVQMSSSKKEKLKIRALELAYANAEEKAKALAKQAGRKLSGASQITESGAMSQPRPMPYARAAVAMEADASGKASVSAGLITLSAGVSVIFELQ